MSSLFDKRQDARFEPESRWEAWARGLFESIDKLVGKLDTSTIEARDRAKALLYRKPKETNKFNSQYKRLCPKAWMMVLGLFLVPVSMFCLCAHVVPLSAFEATVPWLSWCASVPVWCCIAGIGVGMWMFITHPLRYHGHGVLELKHPISEDIGRYSLDDETMRDKYCRFYSESISKFITFSRIRPSSMYTTEMRGLDRLVEAVSFGHVQMDFSPYLNHGSCKKLTQAQRKEIYARYDDAIEKMSAISEIWASKSTGLGDIRIAMFSLEPSEVQMVRDNIIAFGEKLGIESSIAAYMDGVPLEDVIS